MNLLRRPSGASVLPWRSRRPRPGSCQPGCQEFGPRGSTFLGSNLPKITVGIYLLSIFLPGGGLLAAAAQAGPAAEVLDRLATRYGGGEPFSLQATVEYRPAKGDARTFRWDLSGEERGSFLYTLAEVGAGEALGPGEMVWSEGGEVKTWTVSGAPAPVENAFEPLVRRFGEGAGAAFAPLAWAVLGPGALPPPEGHTRTLTSDGREEWRFTGPGWGGARLLVEPGTGSGEDGLPRLLQVRLDTGEHQAAFAEAARQAGLKPPPAWGGAAEIIVRLEISDPETFLRSLGIAGGLDGLETWERDPAAADSLTPEQRRLRGLTPEAAFGEVIQVVASSIAVQPLDAEGRVLEGLTAEDFVLTIGGVEVPVEAIEWRGHGTDASTLEPGASAGAATGEERSVVVVIHRPQGWQTAAAYLLWMIKKSETMIGPLAPEDQVAVVGLGMAAPELLADFGSDGTAITAALRDGLLGSGSGGAERAAQQARVPPPFRSLVRSRNETEALVRLARVLKSMPGEKSILYLGWGLSDQPYQPFVDAIQALAEARVRVMIVTPALTRPMRNLAHHTGGEVVLWSPYPSTGAQTMSFASRRVRESFHGRYILHFTVPDLEGPSPVEVRMARPARGGGSVRYPRIHLLPVAGQGSEESP